MRCSHVTLAVAVRRVGLPQTQHGATEPPRQAQRAPGDSSARNHNGPEGDTGGSAVAWGRR